MHPSIFRLHAGLGLPLLGLLAISIQACTVGPDYQKPAALSAHEFHGTESMQQRKDAAPAPALSEWWTGFADPELNVLIDRALTSNLDWVQAVARVEQARARTQSARAALLPSGQLNAEASRVRSSVEDPLGSVANATPGFDRNTAQYNVNVGASWEVDAFGGLRRGAEAAEGDYQATQAEQVAVRLSVAAQTADTYVLLRTIQARLDVVHERMASQTKLVMLIRLLYSRGLAPELQLHQAEGVLATVSAGEPALLSSQESTLNAIDVLLAVEPGTTHKELQAQTPIPSAPQIASAGGPAELIRRRPDIIAAENRLKASNARIGEALSDYYPKFSLSALLGSATGVGSNLFSGDANYGQAVLGLRWRLFDFGRVDAQVASAKGSNAEALAAYRLTLLNATADVENAFTEVVQRENQARILLNGETSLSKAKTAALASFQSGNVSFIEVIDADDRLQQAQDNRILAQSAATRAAIASFRALGGGWNSEASIPATVAAIQ